jgi:hypothetical protein
VGPAPPLTSPFVCYDLTMRPRSFALASALLTLAACDGAAATGGGPQGPSGGGSGPLAGLESSPFQNEVWMNETGQQVAFLYYPRENLRVSAQCRSASGQFVCEAMRFMRNGMPVEIARRALDGRTSAGVKVCMRMNLPIVTVRNSVGAEDGLCQFPDGSLVANAALEQYKMRVIQ